MVRNGALFNAQQDFATMIQTFNIENAWNNSGVNMAIQIVIQILLALMSESEFAGTNMRPVSSSVHVEMVKMDVAMAIGVEENQIPF